MDLDSSPQSLNFALINDLAELNRQTMQRIVGDIFLLEKVLGRNVNVLERNLISMQPRCIAWYVCRPSFFRITNRILQF